MSVFQGIRLSIWGVLLAACLVVVNLYSAASHTVLTTQGLEEIAHKSNAYQHIRDDIITPRAVEAMGTYTAILPRENLAVIIKETLPDTKLDQLASPVITSTRDWLDSKQPDIRFSIDTHELRDTFTTKLTETANKNLENLPACTSGNTLTDIVNAICRTPYISVATQQDMLSRIIASQSDTVPVTFTEKTIVLPGSLKHFTNDVPSYLNMLYAMSIVTGGFAALTTLWLLLKWRLRGIIALGASLIAASIGTAIIASIIRSAHLSALETPYREMAVAGAGVIADRVMYYVLPAILGGIALILIAIAALVLWRRHRSKAPAPQVHDTSEMQ